MVLLAMTMVVQFALAYYAKQVLAGAAQDGAAAGARRSGSVTEAEAVADDLVAQAGTTLLLSYDTVARSDGDRMTVTITGEAVSLLPFQRSLTVTAAGSVPVESFRPQEVGS